MLIAYFIGTLFDPIRIALSIWAGVSAKSWPGVIGAAIVASLVMAAISALLGATASIWIGSISTLILASITFTVRRILVARKQAREALVEIER